MYRGDTMRLLMMLFAFGAAIAHAAPPEKPQKGDADERARALVDAIKKNDPALAAPFFFDRAAFRSVKGLNDPDKYFNT